MNEPEKRLRSLRWKMRALERTTRKDALTATEQLVIIEPGRVRATKTLLLALADEIHAMRLSRIVDQHSARERK